MCVRVQFTRGTVQSQHFYFDRNNFFLLQRIKNTLYYAIFTPSFKSLVNAIPFAVFLWKCPPLAPIFGNIQDSVDKCVIVDFYIPTLNRKILFDSCVLRFCDIRYSSPTPHAHQNFMQNAKRNSKMPKTMDMSI